MLSRDVSLKKKKRTLILLLEAAVLQQGLTETAVMYPCTGKGSSRGEVDIYFFLPAWSQEGREQGRQRSWVFVVCVFSCPCLRVWMSERDMGPQPLPLRQPLTVLAASLVTSKPPVSPATMPWFQARVADLSSYTCVGV